MSFRKIGQLVGLSHNTIARYNAICKGLGLTSSIVDELSDEKLKGLFFSSRQQHKLNQKSVPDFEAWLNEMKIKGVTLELLWQEYRANDPDGYSYTHTLRLYKNWIKKLNVTLRQTHLAGEKLFVDYSGKRVPIVDPDTKQKWFAEFFVATLGASNYTYAEASPSQKIHHWIGSNVNALEFFGGVPKLIVPDNLKSAVVKNSKGDVVLNKQYIELARHYRTAIIPTRPGKPKDKSKVEGAVRIAQTWILAKLRHKIFYSVAEANESIKELLIEFNNRPFKKIEGTRLSRFDAIDKPALKPLPRERFEHADWKVNCRVGSDYCLEFDQAYYMVPSELIGQYLSIRATPLSIEIFFGSKRVASHSRSYKPGAIIQNTAFMPESHRNYKEWNISKLSAWAQSLGESTVRAFERLLIESSHTNNGMKTCIAIVNESARDGVGYERMENALALAMDLNSVTISTIRSILRTGKDKTYLKNRLEVKPQSENEIKQSFLHIRGSDYFQ